jgi:hypothetical protein
LEQERLEERERARTLRQLERTAAKRKLYVDAIKECLTTFEPSPPIKLRKRDAKTKVYWVLQLSDWHIGQKTPIETTGGMYEQDVAKTYAQVKMLLDAVTSIYYEAEGKVVEELWVQVDGDLVDGDALRPSQLRQIELPVVQQTVEAWNLMSVLLRSLLELPIKRIVVDIVGGNHDRTTTKAGLAGLGEADYVDTFAYIIGAYLQRSFEDEPRIEIKNWETYFGTRKFGGRTHVFEHGSSIRGGTGSYGGVPWYPIHNAARKYHELLGGVDMVWFGHFHVPYFIPLAQGGWIVGNGALPATSPYAQSQLKAMREPQQWLVELHKDKGSTKFEPLYVGIDLPKPGSVWEES